MRNLPTTPGGCATVLTVCFGCVLGVHHLVAYLGMVGILFSCTSSGDETGDLCAEQLPPLEPCNRSQPMERFVCDECEFLWYCDDENWRKAGDDCSCLDDDSAGGPAYACY